ncbi:MAG: tRNA (adenosine(37)-N6)-dimethylallyltransferase MiaA [Bacteroidales bacterium]|nr:tRNA (adenosine(37)-N6)-dimethylallyltransferase MiaA [Bacteroidales bacterium]
MTKPLIVILGPTATGKTDVAVHVAHQLNADVISADSRQVFRGMDIGTGKDLSSYTFDNHVVKYHLIDIVDAGTEYSVFNFQQDFLKAYYQILEHQKLAVLCGGTGLYIESILKGYRLLDVPENQSLRQQLASETDETLIQILSSFKKLHNHTDTETRERLIRAIEIEYFHQAHPEEIFPKITYRLFGILFDRSIVMQRIEQRLYQRLDQGMIEEVQQLLQYIPSQRLMKYGLEYKYITQMILGEISYDEMVRLLNIAIRQFAKRQMTWFRKMERDGFDIQWIDGNLALDEKCQIIIDAVQ